MTPDDIQKLFTRADGHYLCARWARPISPVGFGVDEATLAVGKGAVEAVVALAGHKMAETDPELGANLMVFFFRDWAELPEVPNLDRLIPDLGPLCARLEAADANQYRIFRFDADGGIKACFVFVRMDAHLRAVPVEVLALNQAVQLGKVGRTHIALDDLAALVEQVSGGRELHIAPGLGIGSGVVNRHLEGQLA